MPRPLPLAIAAMLLLAGVKLTGLLQASGLTAAAQASTPASAVAASAHASAVPPRPAPQPAPPAAAAPAVSAAPPEPPVDAAERAILQDLRARRVQLEARAHSVEAREAILAAAERRLSERVEQLSALQTKLEQLEAGRRERDDANWRSLVKTYETMRPREAAAIMNELDGPVLLQVLDRMKEAKAAPVLAAMQPERARAVTAQLAQFRSRGSAAPSLTEPEPRK